MTSPSMALALQTIAKSVAEIMPDIEALDVSLDSTLSNYGCNSIDRADIVWKTLEDLQLDISPVEFTQVTDIRCFAELLCRHLDLR
ncbi:MAG: sle [Myxococcaceae bacterium]|nr:sle [Myxococcaceae bacterium]